MMRMSVSNTEPIKERVEISVEVPGTSLLENIPPEKLRKLSDEATVKYMASGNYFAVKEQNQFKNIFLRGVNLGVAMPGYFPSQFSMSRAEYLNWFDLISRMNANTIRVYTVLPPDFYEALAQFNYEHSNRQLFLVQGVWINDPEMGIYTHSESELNFKKEIAKAIDVIHGNALALKKAGSAEGIYSTDVSQFVVGIVLGHEWDSKFVSKTNLEALKKSSLKERFSHYGNFITLHSGTPMENWLAKMIDFTATYEISKYHEQRPLSFINWQALDPMFHSQEYSRRNGQDYDGEAIDMRKFNSTELFRAGLFAAVHAYPYFPDFVYLEDKYSKTKNRKGVKDSYKAYLEDLKSNLPDIPMLVAEYGLSSSRGNSRFNPDGFHQGSHSEAEQADLSKQLTWNILDAGAAGALFFEWADEWFKPNWLTQKMEQPADRIIYWHNKENPEQNYGIMAIEVKGKIIDGLINDWNHSFATDDMQMIYDTDPAYINFAFRIPGYFPGKDELLISLVTKKTDNRIKSVEHVIKLKDKESSAIMCNDFRSKQQLNEESQNIFSEKPSPVFYDQSKLKFGKSSDSTLSNSDWYYDSATSVIELRLPWNLLHISDPSSRSMTMDSILFEIEGFQLSATVNDRQIGSEFLTWEKWDEPDYKTRLKPIFSMFQKLMPELVPENKSDNDEPSKPSAKILAYKHGKPGAATIEFDGALYTQIREALPYLSEYRFRSDFHILSETGAGSSSSLSVKNFTKEEIENILLLGHDTTSAPHKNDQTVFHNLSTASEASLHSLDSLLVKSTGKWIQLNYSAISKDFNHSIFHRQLRIVRNSNLWISTSREIRAYHDAFKKSVVQMQNKSNKTYSIVLRSKKAISRESQPLSVEYVGNGKKIKVTGSAADGIYELRNNRTILELFIGKETTIEVIVP
jgi:hypothetical protein